MRHKCLCYNNSMEEKMYSGLFWRLMEKGMIRVFSFAVTIIIARIITPEDYGVVAIISSVIEIFAVFIDSGLGNSLIQKKDSDDLDFSTVFCTNFVFCIILYIIIFSISPIVSNFYSNPLMTPLIRVSGITILISAFKNIQQAYISKTLDFRKFFYCSLIGTLVSGIVAVIMAYSGFGVWSLVALNLIDCAIDTLAMFFFVEWKPRFRFAFDRIKPLFSYGWKLTTSSLIDVLFGRVVVFAIGKYESSASLAYFDKGYDMPSKITNGLNQSLSDVLLPSLANKQNDIYEFKNTVKEILKLNYALLLPLIVGLAVASKNVILVLLTEKWLPSLPYFVVSCILCLLLPIHTINLSSIKAIGKSNYYLRQEIIKKCLSLFSIFILFKYGVLVMAWSLVVADLISVFVDTWYSKELYDYSLSEQIADILPSIFISAVVGTVVYLISFISISNLLVELIIQILVGAIIYLVLTFLMNKDSVKPLFNMIKDKLKK